MPPPDHNQIRNTKALEELTRTLKEQNRILDALNTNLVQLGRLMKENQDG